VCVDTHTVEKEASLTDDPSLLEGQPEPPLTEPVAAPEIYVDGYQTSSMRAGVAKFTFFTMVHDPANNAMERRINLRLAASMPVLIGIHSAMGEFIEQVMTANEVRRRAN
jgi:hypothetical protein